MKNTSALEQFRLDGQTSVVTGGCGNLGPWWAKALLEAGTRVALLDLPGTKIPEILSSYEQKGTVRLYEVNILSLDDLSAAYKRLRNDFEPVTILINNAGIDAPPVKAEKNGTDNANSTVRYRAMWDVNVQGMVNCMEEFLPGMKEKKQGSIINIGSLYADVAPNEVLYGHLGFDKPWAYGATKAAVVQLTRHYATRLAKYGIRVNTLSPGGVAGNQDEEFIRKYSDRVPLQRMAEKEDLAGPLIFLASNASRYVTGINLQVNGGYTAW